MGIRVDLITVDAAIQQRAIDDEVVSRYMALMQDGVEFPPMELVFDGNDYWLWNGFYRYQCAKKLKQTEITARVKNGSKRDALWLSFSANKDHGFRRQSGVPKRIIERILIDKVWSKKSLTAIAEHVGVTRVYVPQIKNELSAHGVNSLHDRNGESGVSEAETDTDETTNRTAERS